MINYGMLHNIDYRILLHDRNPYYRTFILFSSLI
jgi:hypothetical protein